MAGEYIEFDNNNQPAVNDTNLNRLQQLIKQDIQGAVSGDTLPIGTIVPFGSNTVPENWLLCDGSAVSRTTYQDLFNTIGITYGQGDGFETFNLPNLKDRVPVGKDSNDTDFNLLGNTGGEKTHTLTVEEIPSHTHQIAKENWTISASTGTITIHNYAGTERTASGSTGGGQAHNILQPYIVTNYIIKAFQSAGTVATVVDNLNSTSTTDALSANQGNVLNEKIDNNATYSETEQTIGIWTDGKPLYRKVINGTKVSGTDLSLSIGSNISKIVNVSGHIREHYVMPYYENSTTFVRVEFNVSPSNNGTVIIKSGTSEYSNGATTIIVEYTKTTD